jgi:hypothetical protein
MWADVPLPYSVALTKDEYTALLWLEARGYSGDLIKHATTDDQGDDGRHVLRYREADAWAVQAAYEDDPRAFGACAGVSLLEKMRRFLDGVV